jgi:hypothetical protein
MGTGFLFQASFFIALLANMLLLADYADARGQGRVVGGGRGAAPYTPSDVNPLCRAYR